MNNNNKITPENYEARIFTSDDVLDELLRFQRIVLRIFGLYHHPNDSIVWKIYCMFVVFILLGFDVVRHLILFDKNGSFNSKLLMEIIVSLFPLYCFLNGLIMFIIQEHKSKIFNFNLNFNIIFNEYQTETRKNIEMRKIKQISIITTCITMIITILIVIIHLVSLLGPSEIRVHSSFKYFEFNGEFNIAYRIVIAIIFCFTLSACMMVASYYFMYFLIMSRLLDYFNQNFKEFSVKNELKLNDESICEDETGFERLRVWYLKLCDLIIILSNCFKNYIFNTLMINVPIIILILFIVSDPKDCTKGINKISLSMWFIVAVALILTVVIITGKINTKVYIYT